MTIALEIHELSVRKVRGASPAEDRFYIVVLFDISDAKKYRQIIKVLKSYGSRIQYSIFEAYLKRGQITELIQSLEHIMSSTLFYNPHDQIRVYQIAGNCELTVFGSYIEKLPEEDVFV